jgi:hypothetical protein
MNLRVIHIFWGNGRYPDLRPIENQRLEPIAETYSMP